MPEFACDLADVFVWPTTNWDENCHLRLQPQYGKIYRLRTSMTRLREDQIGDHRTMIGSRGAADA
jgi:hypothetical protein